MIYEDTETLYRFQPRIIAIGSFSVRIQIQFWRQACIVCDRLPLGALAQALMLHSRTSLLIFHRLIVSHFGTQVFLCRSTVSRHRSLFRIACGLCLLHNAQCAPTSPRLMVHFRSCILVWLVADDNSGPNGVSDRVSFSVLG